MQIKYIWKPMAIKPAKLDFLSKLPELINIPSLNYIIYISESPKKFKSHNRLEISILIISVNIPKYITLL